MSDVTVQVNEIDQLVAALKEPSTVVVSDPSPKVTVVVKEEVSKIFVLKETEIIAVSDVGKKGDKGDKGDQGNPGVAGPTSPSYEHIQSSASSSWNVNHNLGFKPILQIYDSGGNVVEAEILHISTNLAIVYFAFTMSGVARCI